MKHFDGMEINQGEKISVTLAKPDDPNAKLKKIQKHQQRNASHSEFIFIFENFSTFKILKKITFTSSATNATNGVRHAPSVRTNATNDAPGNDATTIYAESVHVSTGRIHATTRHDTSWE